MSRTIVHGWCGFVEKSNEFTCKMMVLNKLWIPDVLIDIIKDYLYISAEEVLRKHYKLYLIDSIKSITYTNTIFKDTSDRYRMTLWYLDSPHRNTALNGFTCITCGESSHRHTNIYGCCPLIGDDTELNFSEIFIDEDGNENNVDNDVFSDDGFTDDGFDDADWAINDAQEEPPDDELPDDELPDDELPDDELPDYEQSLDRDAMHNVIKLIPGRL